MNKALISGRICSVPITTVLTIGQEKVPVCTFVISVKEKWTEYREGHEINDSYDFFQCFSIGNLAKDLSNSFVKNSKVGLYGRFKNFMFEDGVKTKHFTNIFVVEEIEYGDTKSYFSCEMVNKKKNPDLSLENELQNIGHAYNQFVKLGFSAIDESDYYRLTLAMMK